MEVETQDEREPVTSTQALLNMGAKFTEGDTKNTLPYCVGKAEKMTKDTFWTVYNRRYTPVHGAAACCNITNGQATRGVTPEECQSVCDDDASCNFFSHSTSLLECRRCLHCNFHTEGDDRTYTSWQKAATPLVHMPFTL